MKLLFPLIGLVLAVSVGAQANKANVVIKHADKVIIKSGMSHHKIKGMIYCLNSLKKHETAEAAIDDAMPKVAAFCEKAKIDAKHCEKKQRKIAGHIHFCYEKAEFFRNFMTSKSDASAKSDS